MKQTLLSLMEGFGVLIVPLSSCWDEEERIGNTH